MVSARMSPTGLKAGNQISWRAVFDIVQSDGTAQSDAGLFFQQGNRINWSEITMSNSSMHQEKQEDGTVKMEDASNLSKENSCILVWEGELKTKSFRKWTTSKCASEGEVRKVLERNKMENYWTLAKRKVLAA